MSLQDILANSMLSVDARKAAIRGYFQTEKTVNLDEIIAYYNNALIGQIESTIQTHLTVIGKALEGLSLKLTEEKSFKAHQSARFIAIKRSEFVRSVGGVIERESRVLEENIARLIESRQSLSLVGGLTISDGAHHIEETLKNYLDKPSLKEIVDCIKDMSGDKNILNCLTPKQLRDQWDALINDIRDVIASEPAIESITQSCAPFNQSTHRHIIDHSLVKAIGENMTLPNSCLGTIHINALSANEAKYLSAKIRVCPKISDIALLRCEFSPKALVEIIKSLKKNTSLRSVNFEGTFMGQSDEVVTTHDNPTAQIGIWLKQNPENLKRLVLRNCHISNAHGTTALLNGLKHNTHLRELDLGNNFIDCSFLPYMYSLAIDGPSDRKLGLAWDQEMLHRQATILRECSDTTMKRMLVTQNALRVSIVPFIETIGSVDEPEERKKAKNRAGEVFKRYLPVALGCDNEKVLRDNVATPDFKESIPGMRDSSIYEALLSYIPNEAAAEPVPNTPSAASLNAASGRWVAAISSCTDNTYGAHRS